MAIYVTSDTHGHVRALDEALCLASIGKDDELYMLGDMIDRGPDPLGVVNLLRDMDNAHVIMGNHEELMIEAVIYAGAPVEGHFDLASMDNFAFTSWLSWMQNGGGTTAEQLESYSKGQFGELMLFIKELPRYAVVEAAGRTYILVHAGINPKTVAAWRSVNPNADLTRPFDIEELMQVQTREDLTWIREEFWGTPTGLIDGQGSGPVVVAGHTPTLNLALFVDPDIDWKDEGGHAKVVRLGACEATGGVADRIDIDSGAAAGAGIGQVSVMRLDDGEIFAAPIKEGE